MNMECLQGSLEGILFPLAREVGDCQGEKAERMRHPGFPFQAPRVSTRALVTGVPWPPGEDNTAGSKGSQPLPSLQLTLSSPSHSSLALRRSKQLSRTPTLKTYTEQVGTPCQT